MSKPIIVAGRLVIEDQTKKGMDKAKKGITGSLKDIAKSAAGFLARDVVRSLVGVGKESIQLGAKIETLQTSFEAMRDPVLDVDLNLENLRAATQDTVSDIDLLTAANNAMALGLPTNELDDMFAAAQRVGAAMGRTTLEAVQDLTTGIGRQSKMILDNLGILVDTEDAYETIADRLGKTSEELTDAERKTGFMEAAIDSLNEKSETLGDNLSDTQLAQEQFSAAIENMKTDIGTILIPALSDAMTSFSGIIDIVSEVVTAIKEGDWDSAVDTIAGAFSSLGTKITEVLLAIDWIAVIKPIVPSMLEIGGALTRAIIEGMFKAPSAPTEREGGGPLGPSHRAFQGPLLPPVVDPIPPAGDEPRLRRENVTVNINIDNLVGTDEEAAETFGEVAAENFVKELEKMGVRVTK